MTQLASPERLISRRPAAGVEKTCPEPRPTQASVAVSQASLETLVVRRLQTSGYRGLSIVVCQTDRGRVTLNGHVRSFYMKQLAQEFARRVDGVTKVDNRLVVRS